MDTRSDELAAPKRYQSSDWLLNRTFKSERVQSHPQLSGWAKSSGTPLEKVWKLKETRFMKSTQETQETTVAQKLGADRNMLLKGDTPNKKVQTNFNFLSRLLEVKIPPFKLWGISTENSSSMIWMKRYTQITTLAVSLTLGLVLNVPSQAQAQPSSLSSLPDSWGYKPPERGNPDHREQGATRQPIPCTKGLTALTPLGVGLTVAEYPTFSWYMPSTSARSAEFVLMDASEREVYKANFAIAGRPGIYSLNLPTSANLPPLAQNQEYYWEVSVICDANNREKNIVVGGAIKRVAPDPALTRQIQRATLRERVGLYAQARLWHETLATLLELRRLSPNDSTLASDWKKLLVSVQLDKVASEPIVQSAASRTSTRSN